jgi:hypothetical protein
MDSKVIVGIVIALVVLGGIGYYIYSQGMPGGEQEMAASGKLLEETFSVVKGDHRALTFEVTSDGTEVYWEWSSDRDVNFYLMTEEEYDNWDAGESFRYMHRRKFRSSGSYKVSLNQGKYVLVWNSPYGDAEITAKVVAD